MAWPQVIIMQRQGTDPKDVAFLAGLLRDFPQDYSLVEPELSTNTGRRSGASLFLTSLLLLTTLLPAGFWHHYDYAEPGQLYLKLDDDVVYIRVRACCSPLTVAASLQRVAITQAGA